MEEKKAQLTTETITYFVLAMFAPNIIIGLYKPSVDGSLAIRNTNTVHSTANFRFNMSLVSKPPIRNIN